MGNEASANARREHQQVKSSEGGDKKGVVQHGTKGIGSFLDTLSKDLSKFLSLTPRETFRTEVDQIETPITPQKKTIKVLLLGDPKTGKSALLSRYVNNKFTDTYIHTIGVDFCTKEVYLDYLITLQIWDITESCSKVGVEFHRGADCVALVFDVNDRTSFENLDLWRDNFLSNAKLENPETVPFVVIGNKMDTELDQHQVSQEEAQAWCQKYPNTHYFETSALHGTNVEEAFTMVASFPYQQWE